MGGVILKEETALLYLNEVFDAIGLKKDYGEIIAKNLVEAELRGVSSHGLSRLSFYHDKLVGGGFNKTPNMKVVEERLATFVLDSDSAPGAVAGQYAMKKCIEKAKTAGVCVGSVRNCNHYGIAAFYSMLAASEDMIGITCCNTVSNMAPFGGSESVFGTNPISIALPTGGDAPFVYDGATSKVAQGKVIVANKEKREIPIDWALDEDGNPTTDPSEALKGAMLPFGEHKGSGIAMAVDILSAALSMSAFSPDVLPLRSDGKSCQNIGFFFMAIDISAFRDLQSFKEEVSDFIKVVKGSRPLKGTGEIFTPGEIEHKTYQKNKKEGFFVGEGVLAELSAFGEKYKLKTKLI